MCATIQVSVSPHSTAPDIFSKVSELQIAPQSFFASHRDNNGN
jgi:hypothetical protein